MELISGPLQSEYFLIFLFELRIPRAANRLESLTARRKPKMELSFVHFPEHFSKRTLKRLMSTSNSACALESVARKCKTKTHSANQNKLIFLFKFWTEFCLNRMIAIMLESASESRGPMANWTSTPIRFSHLRVLEYWSSASIRGRPFALFTFVLGSES